MGFSIFLPNFPNFRTVSSFSELSWMFQVENCTPQKLNSHRAGKILKVSAVFVKSFLSATNADCDLYLSWYFYYQICRTHRPFIKHTSIENCDVNPGSRHFAPSPPLHWPKYGAMHRPAQGAQVSFKIHSKGFSGHSVNTLTLGKGIERAEQPGGKRQSVKMVQQFA